jgi:IS605 OrfB family transposase
MNQGKYDSLDRVMVESVRVVNEFINLLWDQDHPKFVTNKVTTWLSARLQQCLGKQALEIIKSQRKKHPDNRTKPTFTKESITLDERFLDIQEENEGMFDIWFKFGSLGDSTILKIPSHKHVHFNEFVRDGWEVKKSCRLRRVNGVFYLDLFLEKEAPEKRSEGSSVGFDCGYKKLLMDSNGNLHDTGLEPIYQKIAGKKQGSKGFLKALRHRDQAIHETVKNIDLSETKEVIVEALKNVKKGSKGKIRKSFNNKLQRWVYSKVLNLLSMRCEREGIEFKEVPPAYTSQTCSSCGAVDRKSRNGESYRCTTCGFTLDADHNAAINILHLGSYSTHAKMKQCYGLP